MKKKVVKKKKIAKKSRKLSAEKLAIRRSLLEHKRRVKENQEKQRKATRDALARQIADKQRQWDICKHLQGSNILSVGFGTLTSIVWHFFPDKTLRGICTNCQRWFIPSDSDYGYWISLKTGNIPSSSISIGRPVLPVNVGDWTKEAGAAGVQFNDLTPSPVPAWRINDDSLDPNDWSDQKLKDRINELKTQSGK